MGLGGDMSLPMMAITAKELELRGWDYVDVVLFSGDAYVDHPSFGAAVIGRTLEAAGYQTINLSDPLEDGSRVLDSQTDLPECQVQTTFLPEGGSTMITVLFAAGCVALGG